MGYFFKSLEFYDFIKILYNKYMYSLLYEKTLEHNQKPNVVIKNIKYECFSYYSSLRDTLNKIQKIKSKEYLNDADSVLYNNLMIKIVNIALFRAAYSVQFPKKAKKFKNLNKHYHKYNYLKNTDKSRSKKHVLHLNRTLFLAYFIDIKEKIEDLLGIKLCFIQSYNLELVPEKVTVKVIEKSYETKPIKYVYEYKLKEKNPRSYFFFDNKYFSSEIGYQVYVNDKDTIRIPEPYIKTLTKRCRQCNTLYDKKVLFIYSKKNDLKSCSNCFNKIENYKEPVRNSSNIFNEYHSNRNNWQFIICNKRNENSLPIGMELELELKPQYPLKNKNSILLDLHRDFGQKNVIFERDGSLNEGGVEIIVNPMTIEYAKNFWIQPCKKLNEITHGIYSGVLGITSNNCADYWGIHLTTHRKYWNSMALIKTINFINAFENRKLIWKIAQRRTLYGGDKIAQQRKDNTNKPYLIWTDLNDKSNKKILSFTRTTAVNLKKDNFVEMRFFQATSNYLEIMKNYEFIKSLHEYFHNNNTNLYTTSIEYLKWLLITNKNNKIHNNAYTNLITYINKEDTPTRFSSGVKSLKYPLQTFLEVA